jgi:LPXTG-motif cell wall-anchored protein
VVAFELDTGPLGVWWPIVVGLTLAAALLMSWTRRIKHAKPI